ncbi:MAG: N-6 DNA methylase [Acetobacter sp.]|nr:N-6 DNA methylase [Acetobacter sp.]
MQLVAKENHLESTVPLKLSGQELQAESFALGAMNAIIHDMDVEFARGDTMMNPKFLDENGSLKTHDIVVANPMWNQSFDAKLLEEDRFDRFSATGVAVIGKKKGDWSWLQHTLACLSEHGRAAVVLDTGAVTRGSGEKKDKERAARKWFVDNDVIDGVILLPDNLFYNTPAAGVIVFLNKNKPAEKKGKITLLDASACFQKGRPKNYLPQDSLRALANQYRHAGTANESHKDDPQTEADEQVDPNNAQLGRVKVITLQEAAEADYNLSPSRWVDRGDEEKEKMQSLHDLPALIAQYQNLEKEAEEINRSLQAWLAKVV